MATSHVLVTGGTGTLGSVVAQKLRDNGTGVRVLSRRTHEPTRPSSKWAVGDLRKGQGIDTALDGIDVILHCATGKNDVASARNLIAAAQRHGEPHLLFISIVGVDSHPLRYYRAKFEVEKLIEASGLPFTILRTTQFHNLIARGCGALAKFPVVPAPKGVSFQPIEVEEVAERLAELASQEPQGRVTDMGGPETHLFSDLARKYLQAAGKKRSIVPFPMVGSSIAAFRAGRHLCPEHPVGRRTFDDFLAAHVARRSHPDPRTGPIDQTSS